MRAKRDACEGGLRKEVHEMKIEKKDAQSEYEESKEDSANKRATVAKSLGDKESVSIGLPGGNHGGVRGRQCYLHWRRGQRQQQHSQGQRGIEYAQAEESAMRREVWFAV